MQPALGAASIAEMVSLPLLLLLSIWLLHEIIEEYSSRRRFARLMALRRFWRQGSRQTRAHATAKFDKYDGRRRQDLVYLGPSEKGGRLHGASGPKYATTGSGRVRGDRRSHHGKAWHRGNFPAAPVRGTGKSPHPSC